MKAAATSQSVPETSAKQSNSVAPKQTNGKVATTTALTPDRQTHDKRNGPHNQKRKRSKKKPKQTNGDEATDAAALPTLFSIMERDVYDGLSHCQPFRMMEMLHKAIRPEPNDLFHACMEVKSDLMIIFGRTFPRVQIDVFGSTIIGTAFKGSFKMVFIQLTFIDRFGSYDNFR